MQVSAYDSDAIRLLSTALTELLVEARIAAGPLHPGLDHDRAVSRKLMDAYDAGARDPHLLKYAGQDAAVLRSRYDAASIDCVSACNFDPLVEWAPGGGQGSGG